MNFVTPDTKQPLLQKDYETLTCQETGVEYHQVDSIWRMISAERLPIYTKFIREYETVRLTEGRQASNPDFYRQLPQTPPNHPASGMWRQRAQSYHRFLETVLIDMERSKQAQLNILDLGAGNGWLSNRLSERGHHLTAVDLTINSYDGLGVHTAYQNKFTAVQAEFDFLPFENEQFDLTIFNASLHYSTDFEQTLKEAERVMKQTGCVTIIDTPVYTDGESGRQMVAEREASFEQKHGFRSNSLNSENFLTEDKIRTLENRFGAQFKRVETVQKLRQTFRQLKTKLKGKRESAQFPILTFSKQGRSV